MKSRRTGAGWIALIGVAFFVIFLIISLAIDDPGPFVAGIIITVIFLLIALFVFLADYAKNRRWKDVKRSNRTVLITAGVFFLVCFALSRILQEAAFLTLGFVMLIAVIIIVVIRALRDMKGGENSPEQPSYSYTPPRSRGSTSDDIRAGMARAKAYREQQLENAPRAASRSYQFHVAGTSYRKHALMSIATPNPEFFFDDYEIDGPDGWRIYKYTKELPPVALVPEPENEHDPNAIGVYMRGWLIGYVPKDETAKIREIRAQGSYSATAQLAGGPWVSWSGGAKITGEHDMVVTVTVRY